MIGWRVCDVVECFARNSDDVLRNCKVVHALDREWKLLLRPAEHHLSNLTPFWASGNLGADSSCVLAVSILPPDRHEQIWEIQRPLNFPLTVYGIDRSEATMIEITKRLAAKLASHRDDWAEH